MKNVVKRLTAETLLGALCCSSSSMGYAREGVRKRKEDDVKRRLPVIFSSLLILCLGVFLIPTQVMAQDIYDAVSPVGYSSIEQIEQAPRLDTLDGKTIAIVGRSFNATTTQAVLRDCILADYPTATIYTVDDLGCGGVFSVFHQSPQSKQFQEKLIEYGVDAVISGNCGCGLCTVKESGSAIAAEYIGIPTVTVGATTFIPEIHSTGVNRGVPVLRTAEYPGAFSADTQEELKRKSREIIYPLIVEALTTPITKEEVSLYANESYRDYDDVIVSGGYEMLQEYYKECGYSDGLPITIPTDELVQEYLKYTPYEGEELIGSLPLAYRDARVYTVAVNAIMAGCPPEYMPFCVAFARCMADGEWRRTLASTHGWSPYAWINGPIARQLGIDCGQGMISEANNQALGRFIDLAMMNLGGYYVKENRMGTFGYLSAWTFAEDEEACLRVGWDPYHVTQGYDLNANTLTAASALAWGNNVTPATPDPEQITNLMAWDITEKEQNGLGNTNPQVYRTIFITEPVASNLAEGYESKDELEDALIGKARRPLWMRVFANYWANTGSYQYLRRTIQEHYDMLLSDPAEQAEVTAVPAWLKALFPDLEEMVTVATMNKGETPMLIVGDNDRNKFQVMPGGGYATIEIELPYNWDDLMTAKGYEPLANYYLKEAPVLTGPIAVPAELTDGTYRILPSNTQLTNEGRFFYTAGNGLMKYWAWGAAAPAELQIDTESDLGKILSAIGSSSNLTITDGVITDYVIRPSSSLRSTVVDASSLTEAAFRGADLTIAATTVQNSLTGGVSPDGTTIILDDSVTCFKLDLGGTLYADSQNTPGFLTAEDGVIFIDSDAQPGATAKVGAEIPEAPGRYRTFTITMGKGDYTILYTASEVIENPVLLEEEQVCEHVFEWVTDYEPTCESEGMQHEECTLCGEKKESVMTQKLSHNMNDWANAGEQHVRSCADCGFAETENCTYSDATHLCEVCGAPDPNHSFIDVDVTVTSAPGGSRGTKTIYTASISAIGHGVEIQKIEYAVNGRRWAEGTSYSSYSAINTISVRVTDSNGTEGIWLYENGTVTKQ